MHYKMFTNSNNKSQLLLCALFTLTCLYTTAAVIGSSSCGPNFPPACLCGRELYEGSISYIVNCTNTGIQNISVLEFMPDEVEILIFTGNLIPELPWNVFGSINDYKNLKIVDMSNNHIRDIRGKSYHHVQNVERLILNHNNLSISRDDDEINHHHPRVFSNFLNLQSLHLTDAFADNSSPELSEDLHDIFVNSQLDRLEKLHLEQNEITHFKDRNVFCDLPTLRDLHLGDNLLKEINFDVNCLKNLRFLDLERNKFDYVKTHDMMILNELQSLNNRSTNLIVDFNLNPFVCGCRISSFYTWLQSTNVTVRNKNTLMCYINNVAPLPIIELNMNDCASDIAAAKIMFNTAAATATAGAEAGAGAGAATSSRYSDSNSNMANSDGIDNGDATVVRTHMNQHTFTLIFLLIVLSMILLGLVVALVYVSRERIKYIITPVFDNVTKKVQYTSIKDEDCPEVYV